MADGLTGSAAPAPPPRRARRVAGIAKAMLGLLIFLVAAIAGFALLLDTDLGHRLIIDRVAALAPDSGLRIRIGRIEGSIWGETELRDVRLYDQDGLFAEAPRMELDWRPFAWFADRLMIDSLSSELAIVHRAPNLIETPGSTLPGYDIHVGRFHIVQLRFEPAVAGRRQSARLRGEIEYRSGRFLLDLEAAMRGGGDRIDLLVDAAPDRDRLDLRLRLDAPADGVLARMIGARAPLQADVNGAGSWARWDGSARIGIAGQPAGELRLAARSGHYGAGGWLALAPLLEGRLAELAGARVDLSGNGRLDEGVLTGALSARSEAMRLAVRGGADLRGGRYRDLRAALELLRPLPLGAGAEAASGGRLRALLDGPFGDSALTYRLALPRLDLGPAAIEQLQASGSGRVEDGRLTLPVAARAARLSGSDGPLIADLQASGTVVLDGDSFSARRMDFTAERLRGQFGFDADLANGRYAVVGRAATTGRAIEGIGLVDLEADFRLASSGGPAVLSGRARGVVRRVDDGALAWASGGPIRFESGIAGSQGGLRFPNLVLASPALSLSGDAERRGDGSIRFAGSGRQRALGPLALTVDGAPGRPRLAAVLARPAPALGLRDVRLDVEPAALGLGWRARGRSPIGPFAASGSAEVGARSPAIAVAALTVSGAQASGVLRPTGGGLAGRLDFRGALAGPLILGSAAGGGQRIEAHLVASDARLGTVPLGSGRLDAALEIGGTGSLAGSLRFAGAADRLWALAGIEGATLGGPFAVAADLGGTLDRPSLRGTLRLENGRLAAGVTAVDEIEARGTFDLDRLLLERVAGRVRGGGRLEGSGTVGFDGGLALRLAGEGVAIRRGALDSRWDAALRISGTVAAPTLFGEAVLIEGSYRLLGRDVPLTEGTARFDGGIDPLVDILARPAAGALPIRITGRASRPQIGLANPLTSERRPAPLTRGAAETAAMPPRRGRRSA